MIAAPYVLRWLLNGLPSHLTLILAAWDEEKLENYLNIDNFHQSANGGSLQMDTYLHTVAENKRVRNGPK